MEFHKDLGPAGGDRNWKAAAKKLAASDRTRIAHIDSGLFPHPAIGYSGETPPGNLRLDLGRNLYDPLQSPFGAAPLTDLTRNPTLFSDALEFPDHGVKTLSVILSDTKEFRGIAPGTTIVPYRVSNGPLFRSGVGGPYARSKKATATIGKAIDHALSLDPMPRVISISMGNPGALGPFQPIINFLGGDLGMAKEVGRAIARAYARGVIVVCAAGQIIDRVVYPARYAQTIAVGGYALSGAVKTHYPRGGYNAPVFVDAWTLAVGLNRASGLRQADGAITPTYAKDEGGDPDDLSGTSYAAPALAATAAMWIETHHDALADASFAGPGQAWRTVEAFRHILREVLPAEQIASGRHSRETKTIRSLDIERVLKTPPDPAVNYRRREDAGRGFF
ncbi:MAG: S8/S53 family peptidase [Pseudomonadota bacterium]